MSNAHTFKCMYPYEFPFHVTYYWRIRLNEAVICVIVGDFFSDRGFVWTVDSIAAKGALVYLSNRIVCHDLGNSVVYLDKRQSAINGFDKSSIRLAVLRLVR